MRTTRCGSTMCGWVDVWRWVTGGWVRMGGSGRNTNRLHYLRCHLRLHRRHSPRRHSTSQAHSPRRRRYPLHHHHRPHSATASATSTAIATTVYATSITTNPVTAHLSSSPPFSTRHCHTASVLRLCVGCAQHKVRWLLARATMHRHAARDGALMTCAARVQCYTFI